MASVTGIDLPAGDPVKITWPTEDFFPQFWRFCSISSLQATPGNTISWADGRTPTLPIGQPISLSALIPGPGDTTPAFKYYNPPTGQNDSEAKTIEAAVVPLTAVIDYQWRIQVAELADRNKTPTFLSDPITIFENGAAKPDTRPVLAVPGVDYTIVSGNLNSKQLTIMPTPGPVLRAWRISLGITLWWPSRERVEFHIPKTQGVPKSHQNNTEWLKPEPYYLQCLLLPLLPATIPRVPTDDIYSKFPQLCSVKSPQLNIGSSGAASIAAIGSLLPIGQALSLTSQVPSAGTEIPKGGLPLPDGTTIGTPGGLPLGAQVEYKWTVETADFQTGTPKESDYIPARPALSHSDLGGSFEIISGGLTLPSLSFVPWPESSVSAVGNGRAPSRLKRAFRVRLEITLSAPTRAPVTISLPPSLPGQGTQYLTGVVNSWSDTFSIPDGATKPPELPKVLGNLKGASDPLQFLRGLLTATVGDLTPDPGHVTNLLVTPTDKTKQIPSQVKEIINTKPTTKIEAAIDLGAALDNVAKGALGLFGIKSDNNAPAAAALNVLDVLTNIFAIPIAVDIQGGTVTQTLTPLTPLPIPSLEAVPGAPNDLVPGGVGSRAIIGQVPLGGLKALIGTSVNDFSWTVTGATDSVRMSRLSDVFGLSLLPIPVFRPMGYANTNPFVVIDVKLRLNISLPGSPAPITLDLDIARLNLRIPVVPIPQILGITRFPLPDTPYDMAQAYYRESLWFVDPGTAKACSSITAIQNTLATLGNTLKAIFRVIKPEFLLDSQLPMFSGWTDLARTISMMTSLLSAAQAASPSGPRFVPTSENKSFSLNQEIGYHRWYNWDAVTFNFDPAGVSGIMWIGVPQSVHGIVLNCHLVEEIWLPSAYGSSDTFGGFPKKNPGDSNPYTVFSWTSLDIDGAGAAPDIWYTIKADKDKPKTGKILSDNALWNDKVISVQFKTLDYPDKVPI